MPDILANLVGGHPAPQIIYSKLPGNPHAGLDRDVSNAIAEVVIDAPSGANKFYFTSVEVQGSGQIYKVKLALENYASVRPVGDNVTAHTEAEPNQEWVFLYQGPGEKLEEDAYIIAKSEGSEAWKVHGNGNDEYVPRSIIRLESPALVGSPLPNRGVYFQIKPHA